MKLLRKKLPNGLKYLIIPMNGTETVTAMVLVGTGSMYESKRENGLAHFIEHICFKGTTARPTSQIISEEFDSIGAQNNAFTSDYATGYWGKAHKKHASKILDIVADIYNDPLFPESEIEKEKGVVIQEINMYEDNPQFKVGQVLEKLMYGDQPAGRDIAGTKETVGAFTRADILSYHKRNYTPSNTVVIIAGAIDPKKIEKDVKKLFGGAKKAKAPKAEKVKVSQKEVAGDHFNKKTDQVHLAISFHAFNTFDKRNPQARALQEVLSGGMSSRLFRKMREELGICYYVYAHFSAGLDVGSFSLAIGVAPDRVEEAVTALMKEVKNMKDELVGEKELRKVKDMRLSGLVLGLETSNDIAHYYAFQDLYKNKVHGPKEAAKKIEKVTSKEIQAVAKDIFKASRANIALVGPAGSAKIDITRLTKLITQNLG